jgi:ferredoxin
MIFYFSATGNSEYAAKQIATAHNSKLLDISECLKIQQFTFELGDDEILGFVFPVYFLGLPTVVIDFVDKLKLHNYKQNYTFAVCTCGLFSAYTVNRFKKQAERKNMHIDSGFTIKLPDNYILIINLLRAPHEQEKIIENSQTEINAVNTAISARVKTISKKYQGFLPRLVSAISYPIYAYGRSTKPFYATDACTACGLCESICPVQMISMENGKPAWKKGKCAQCIGCLHRCPAKAIQHGRKTIKRGRYVNPKN